MEPTDSFEYQQGLGVGAVWAATMQGEDPEQLNNFRAAWESLGDDGQDLVLGDGDADADADAYSPAERVYFMISADPDRRTRREAADFWERLALGDGGTGDPDFLRGFCRGAMD